MDYVKSRRCHVSLDQVVDLLVKQRWHHQALNAECAKCIHSAGHEVKRPGTYQSPEQKDFQRGMEEAGARYAVVRSIEDVQRLGL